MAVASYMHTLKRKGTPCSFNQLCAIWYLHIQKDHNMMFMSKSFSYTLKAVEIS